MKRYLATRSSCPAIQKVLLCVLAALFLLTCVSPAKAQKDKKKKKDQTDSSKTLVSLNDEQQIDYMLSEMLGAWQLGDIEKLHAQYADDVSMVSGAWAPPVFGWTNYLAVYQQQSARMQKVRMDRSNTYIKVNGNTGWACYQWDFAADVDGQPVESKGQTTVVVEKRNNHWVIVHNHTSVPPLSQQPAPANSPATQPQQPAKPNGR
ncbi:MAG TPA: nuclear transport factor 2 family protein [Candidatus Acidoferrum sp.]|jgi:ketosteroid isomerase-like protein|nr:nuclear transport factor 2 family protein [Candidatus Acidoferrum sp.]